MPLLHSARGRRHGNTCSFLHVASLGIRQTASTPEEDAFEQWLRRTPETVAPIRLRHGLDAWITAAYDFVSGEDENVRQHVVDRMATVGGFSRVKEILDVLVDGNLTEQFAVHAWFSNLALPLLKTISHHEVTKSLILNNIHNLLYGSGGCRGVTLFEAVSLAFTTLSDHDRILDDMNATLTVLRRIVDLNGGAKVNEVLFCPIQAFEEILSQQDLT